jgi:hypothetical protein
MIDETFVIVGALLSFAGSVGYLRDTLKGTTSPNRVSWFLWAFAPMVAFSAEVEHGVGMASMMTFALGFGPLLVFFASFVNRQAVWKLTRFDGVCGVLSIVAILLWQLTGEGNVAILLAILADGLAAVPTIIKSYKNPESENWQVFFFWALSAAITLMTIKTWDFAHYGFPVYIFITFTMLVVLIKLRTVAMRQKLAADVIPVGKETTE